jgi:hypothetical protein
LKSTAILISFIDSYTLQGYNYENKRGRSIIFDSGVSTQVVADEDPSMLFIYDF